MLEPPISFFSANHPYFIPYLCNHECFPEADKFILSYFILELNSPLRDYTCRGLTWCCGLCYINIISN
jgi:hypothetical protein